jgi:zinc transport system ATP-binding protein
VRIEPAISVRDMDFAYDGRMVLSAVSFTIAPRDFVAVVGPNGGGKTTLLKLMLGLLRPLHGEVRVFGQPPERISRRVGYVPQQFQYDPSFPVTVADVVRMGQLGGRAAWNTSDNRRLVTMALERVGLSGLERRPFDALSGGQRQRLLIARALVAGADLLLLDEPTANVDVHGESDISALLHELNDAMTVLVVTHDPTFVSGLVNHVLCVNGRVGLHPTMGLGEVTPELLERMYGAETRVVRHDLQCPPGECHH